MDAGTFSGSVIGGVPVVGLKSGAPALSGPSPPPIVVQIEPSAIPIAFASMRGW
jgi:hypothetical protein